MYLLFDIGGTNMRIGVSTDGKIITDKKIVPVPENFDQGIEVIKQISNELAKGEKIQSVAGGIAVVFNSDKSMPISTSHLHGWVNKPLKQALQEQFQATVTLENDTAVVGLGEANALTDTNNIVAYLTISTGVGGVRIVNKKIDQASFGFEPGHQIIVINGDTCHCGGKGHFETYVGGYYLEKKHNMKAENIKDPSIWDEVAKYAAVGIHNTIVHWSPDLIILGGAVAESLPLEAVQKYLGQFLTIFPKAPGIVKSSLGNQAGLYGALALLR